MSSCPGVKQVCFKLFNRCVLLICNNHVLSRTCLCCLFLSCVRILTLTPATDKCPVRLQIERVSHVFSVDAFHFSCAGSYPVCTSQMIWVVHVLAEPRLAAMSLLFAPLQAKGGSLSEITTSGTPCLASIDFRAIRAMLLVVFLSLVISGNLKK